MSKAYVPYGLPSIHRRRTRFPDPHSVTTTMTEGYLYPIEVREVYPGDEFRDKTVRHFERLIGGFRKPNYGNLFMDTHIFFVPWRLVFEDWSKVLASSAPNAYQDPEYALIPHFSDIKGVPSCQFDDNGIMSHLYGLTSSKGMASYGDDAPAGSDPGVSLSRLKMSVLYARAFAKVYDDWYREENTVPPMLIQTGDISASEVPNNNVWSPQNYTGHLPKVRKIRDRFTSCLPAPQKGAPISLPLAGQARVITADSDVFTPGYGEDSDLVAPLQWRQTNGGLLGASSNLGVRPTNGNQGMVTAASGGSPSFGSYDLAPSNLVVDLSSATGATVDMQRIAFAKQIIQQREALTGGRYTEYIRAAFGVSPSDARLQRSEYLGGFRSPLGVQQVVQTSSSTESDPLGSLAAFGQSAGETRWSKAFEEHGVVIVCASIRQEHTYQQGVRRMFTRRGREDMYDPAFAYIGNQPVYTYELFFDDSTDMDTPDIFGYQDAWEELRRTPDVIKGQAKSYAILPDGAFSRLDTWHIGDEYANAPTLTQGFIEETPNFLDRGINVPSSTMDQYLVQFFFDTVKVSTMPAHSIGRLIDHSFGGVV